MNEHHGSTLDDFLKEEGIYEQTTALASKRVFAWQLQEAMQSKHVTKIAMAKEMKTSRAQIDRILNPNDDNVTLMSLQKAAAVLGKSIKVELV